MISLDIESMDEEQIKNSWLHMGIFNIDYALEWSTRINKYKPRYTEITQLSNWQKHSFHICALKTVWDIVVMMKALKTSSVENKTTSK